MKKSLALVAVALAISGMSVVTRAAPVSTTAGSTVFYAGDNFAIPATISDAVDVTDWKFNLSFDPSLLKADSVIGGSLLSAFGSTVLGAGAIDNRSGLISRVTNSHVDLPPLPLLTWSGNDPSQAQP